MEKKEISITVSGQTATGKSRLVYLLKQFLRNHDFEVEHELNSDYPSENIFDGYMQKNIDNVINNFKETRKILIKEEQQTLTK